MDKLTKLFSYEYLDCPNKNNLFDEKTFFSRYDELTICNCSSEFTPSIEKFIYDVFDFYWFHKFANQWNISEKLYQERLYPNFDVYEYGFHHSTHPSIAELSIYMRTLSMIQFAYVMAGYYIGLPRRFIKSYARKDVTIEQLRLLFYLIDNDNIPLSSIEKLFADFSLEKANKILDIANQSLITSIDEIPVYEDRLYNNFNAKSFCDDYFKSQFFSTVFVVFNFDNFNSENAYYPTEEKLKYYLNHLDFSQFAFVMLGYYYGLSQKLIDSYGNDNISYHSMEFLITKLSGTCLSRKGICNFKRNNICFDKMNSLFNQFKDTVNP